MTERSNILIFPRTHTRPISDPTHPGAPDERFEATNQIAEWHRTLTAQARYMLAQDLSLYASLPAWHKAESVLEMGCGDGAHLSMLARHFPDKRYVGLDLSQGLLDIAANENRAPQVSYHEGDVFAVDAADIGKFDFIIARFLVQHLTSVGPFLMKCAKLLNPGGTVLVYDAHDEATFLHPEVPERVSLFAELAKGEAARAIGRQAVVEVSRDAWRYGFAITGTRDLRHAAVSRQAKEELRDVLVRIFATMDVCLEIERDIARGVEAVHRWCDQPHSFGQFGTRAVILTQRSAGLYSLSRR
jgi:S-adenosylmethionine-diacylgycerolhomoserine-N-methlytransferase